MAMQEGDLVMCTVDRIVGTTVFVKIEDNGEGTIITSEIAPGRIRNIREYVVPGKKIVCKILRIEGKHIHLSLRRVTQKEKKELVEKYEHEKSSIAILKRITPDADKKIEKIKQKEASVYEFLQKSAEKPENLKPYLKDDEIEKLLAILKEKKEKAAVSVKQEFWLSSARSDGLSVIKEILSPYKDKISYLAGGRYSLKIIADDYKKANHEIAEILDEIEKKAKEMRLKFERKAK